MWRGVTPELVLTPRASISERWSAGYGVEIRADGAFGKDGGDPGVVSYSRYLPATDTSVVLLANVDWDETEGLSALLRLFVDTAIPG